MQPLSTYLTKEGWKKDRELTLHHWDFFLSDDARLSGSRYSFATWGCSMLTTIVSPLALIALGHPYAGIVSAVTFCYTTILLDDINGRQEVGSGYVRKLPSSELEELFSVLDTKVNRMIQSNSEPIGH